MKNYEGTFKYIWGASAFKGGELPDSIVPDYSARLKNNQQWLDLMKTVERTTTLSFRGIVLTGWQRWVDKSPRNSML
jgi:hypothetical protein